MSCCWLQQTVWCRSNSFFILVFTHMTTFKLFLVQILRLFFAYFSIYLVFLVRFSISKFNFMLFSPICQSSFKIYIFNIHEKDLLFFLLILTNYQISLSVLPFMIFLCFATYGYCQLIKNYSRTISESMNLVTMPLIAWNVEHHVYLKAYWKVID